MLHLASGERVPFDESYRLCGQCHGEKQRDWRAGVHGRRTGEWNGAQGLPAVRALPQPAPAALQAAGAAAARRGRPTRPGDVDEETVHGRTTRRRRASGLTRRRVRDRVAAAAAAGWLLTACGPRRLHEIPQDELREAIDEMEREYTRASTARP